MKQIYLIDFGTYNSMMTNGLIFDRVGKSAIVKVTRQIGDLPFFQYFKMALYGKISRHFGFRANTIEHAMKITHGMDKDVTWRKQADGKYIPYDNAFDVAMPHLARKTPPTKKVIRKGFIVEVTQ